MAEGGGLLNRYTVQSRIKGSNPFLSATLFGADAICRICAGFAAEHDVLGKFSEGAVNALWLSSAPDLAPRFRTPAHLNLTGQPPLIESLDKRNEQ